MDTVFVVTLEARGAPGTPDERPEPYAALAFARAPTEDAAMALGAEELARAGFVEVRAVRAGEVTDPGALPADFAGAMQTALAYGCGLIIYDEA